MGPGLAEHLHDPREQPLGADAHVHRFDREPQGIDADHRRISRAQAAHCAAAVIGQVDFIVMQPQGLMTFLNGGGDASGLASHFVLDGSAPGSTLNIAEFNLGNAAAQRLGTERG